ncbi:MAG: Ig-like domain-containing protein [Gemmatimonadota bacterium]|nr:Ig-like domain-containing protein [Gemmatimonadota bacterium]
MRRLLVPVVLAAICGCNNDAPLAPDRPITAVTVSPAATTLMVGQSASLSAAVTGGYGSTTVTWTTSNAAVASVSDSGIVSAKLPGTARITATAGGVSGTTDLTVTAGAVDRVAVCDRAQTGGCVNSATLVAVGTSVAVRASAYNAVGADISSTCVFQWVPAVSGAVTLTFFGDNTKRDALITRSGGGITSIVVTCGGTPGVFTVDGLAATPPATP